MNAPSLYLCEDVVDLAVVTFSFPDATVVTAEDFFAQRLGEDLFARERSLFREWYDGDRFAQAVRSRFALTDFLPLWTTLRSLREALSFTEDGIRHAFHEAGTFLGATELRDAAVSYRRWLGERDPVTQALRSQRIPEGAPIHFVPRSTGGSLWFREFAPAAAAAAKRRPSVWRAPLETLGERLVASLVQHRNDRLVCVVDGTGGLRSWLTGRLRRHGVRLGEEILLVPPGPVPSVAHVWWVLAKNALPEAARLSVEGTPSLFSSTALFRMRSAGIEFPERPSLESAAEPRQQRGRFFVDESRQEEVPALAERARSLPRAAKEFSFRGGWDELSLPRLVNALSATQLQTHSRCPSMFALRYRFRLSPKERPAEAFGRRLGVLVHGTLEKFFALPAEARLEPDALARVLQETMLGFAAEDQDPATEPFLRTQGLRLAKGALEPDAKALALFGPRASIDRERPFQWKFEGLPFRGKWDRLDWYGDEKVLLLDYKTSAVSFTPEHAARGEDWQAALYLAAGSELLGPSFLGLGYVDLRERALERGVLRKSLVSDEARAGFVRGHTLDDEKWSSLIDRCRTVVAERAAMVFSSEPGAFAPTPSGEVCGRCAYGPLCRRSALSAAMGAAT